MNKEYPLVSVVISTYNREKLLSRAIDSVLIQDYPNLEIIISDDCSEIDISSLLEEKRNQTNIKIKYRRNEFNSGACHTRNEGIKMASGFFVTGLDDDDEFTFDRISYLVDNYEHKYSFVTTNTSIITKNKILSMFTPRVDKVISYEDNLWDNVIGTQVLTEKSKFIECRGFDVELTSSQDFDMWLRLMRQYGPALRLKHPKYILHTEHESDRISTSSRKLDGMKLFNKKYLEDMNTSQRKYAHFKLLLWENNRKLNFNMLKTLDLGCFYFIFKKILKLI